MWDDKQSIYIQHYHWDDEYALSDTALLSIAFPLIFGDEYVAGELLTAYTKSISLQWLSMNATP